MIKRYLLNYKDVTEVIIVNIKNNLDVEEAMKKREEILNNLLEDINLNKEEIKRIYLELKLDDLDKTLKEEINRAIEKNKEELRKMKNQRSANKAYGKNISTINFFNKKI